MQHLYATTPSGECECQHTPGVPSTAGESGIGMENNVVNRVEVSLASRYIKRNTLVYNSVQYLIICCPWFAPRVHENLDNPYVSVQACQVRRRPTIRDLPGGNGPRVQQTWHHDEMLPIARCRAVLPTSSAASRSAPFSTSRLVTSRKPRWDEIIKAVAPRLLSGDRLAPLDTRSLAKRRSFRSAESMSGVYPSGVGWSMWDNPVSRRDLSFPNWLL